MARRMFKGNAAATTLASPITNASTSFTVVTNGGATHPDGSTGPFVETLDFATPSGEEKVLCSARSGDVFTILTRGYDGTTATSHAAGAAVRHTISAVDLDEANAHLNDTSRDDHTQYALVKRGLAALRGAASRGMKFHYGTDSGLLGLDDGTAWHDFQDKASADAAYPSLTLIDAKGDLLVGSADNTVIRKAVGSDGQVLTADAASAGGVKWAAAAAGGTTDTSWTAPALANSWTNVQGTAGYRRQAGIVLLRGGIGSGTTGVMFTLPVGLRPIETTQFPVVKYDGSGTLSVDFVTIGTNGIVTSNYVPPGGSPGAYVLLNGIRLLAEQ